MEGHGSNYHYPSLHRSNVRYNNIGYPNVLSLKSRLFEKIKFIRSLKLKILLPYNAGFCCQVKGIFPSFIKVDCLRAGSAYQRCPKCLSYVADGIYHQSLASWVLNIHPTYPNLRAIFSQAVGAIRRNDENTATMSPHTLPKFYLYTAQSKRI